MTTYLAKFMTTGETFCAGSYIEIIRAVIENDYPRDEVTILVLRPEHGFYVDYFDFLKNYDFTRREYY